MSPNVIDLRTAALSDHKHRASTTDGSAPGLLHILLPDVLGEPFGGLATQAQVSAVFNAIGTVFPSTVQVRPQHLRAAMRAWAARQSPPLSRQEQALRWLAGPCDRDTTPGWRCWDPEVQPPCTPDSPYLSTRWCEPCTAAYGLGEGPDVTEPDPVPADRRGQDQGTGLRTTIQAVQGLDENGQPDLLARLQASLTRAKDRK